MRRAFAVAVLSCSLLASVRAEDETLPALRFTKSTLPQGWTLGDEVEVAKNQLEPIGQKLGGKLRGLVNQKVSINGFDAQVNICDAASEEDARAIEAGLTKIRGADFVARRGQEVLEVTGKIGSVAAVVRAALKVAPRTATYDAELKLACAESVDYEGSNLVFNHCLELAQKPGDAATEQKIETLIKTWQFGHKLRLREQAGAKFECQPKPTRTDSENGAVVFTFGDLPELAKIPHVVVKATFESSDRFVGVEGPVSAAATEANRWFPAKDPALKALAEKLTAGLTNDRERVLALLRYLAHDIAYSGPVGTRWGAAKVASQRFGRCWDKSDVLVTLCRALAIPAREVMGWLVAEHEGHIWTEVHLPNEGWIPVDATTLWLGASADYVVFTATEDGEMPLVHVAMPRFERRSR